MDPLSQALVGSVAAGLFAKKEKIRHSIVVGALAAMSADLDILFHSSHDPLLGLEFHRHFTHSLIFIPVGALISSWILGFLFRVSWRDLYLPALSGYATAGVLDALTSYGTHLFWPFTQERTAWNLISIIDPIYTLTLLFLVVLTFFKKRTSFLRFAFIFMFFWHSLGWVQRQRAHELLRHQATQKELLVKRYWVQPSLGNLILWRGLIETEDKIFVFGLRVAFDKAVYNGGVLPKYFPEDDLFLKANSLLEKDVQRFITFSKDFVAIADLKTPHILDMRYSSLPWEVSPLWALELDYKNQDNHAQLNYFREVTRNKLYVFWQALKGKGIFLQ